MCMGWLRWVGSVKGSIKGSVKSYVSFALTHYRHPISKSPRLVANDTFGSSTTQYIWHNSCIGVTWLILICDMIHSYVWHNPFISVTWLTHGKLSLWFTNLWLFADDSIVSSASDSFTARSRVYCSYNCCAYSCALAIATVPFVCVTRFVHVFHVNFSYAWHGWFTYVTWFIHCTLRIVLLVQLLCAFLHSGTWTWLLPSHIWTNHVTRTNGSVAIASALIAFAIAIVSVAIATDPFVRMTWFLHMCNVSRSYAWRDSFICVTWLIHVCDMTHSYVWRGWFIRRSD